MILYLFIYFTSVVIFFYTLPLKHNNQVQFATWFLVGLGIFIGLSDMLGGYDRYIYAEIFDHMADETSSGGNPFLSSGFTYFSGEFGYGTINALMTYVTSNRYIFIFSCTMIIYFLLIVSLRKYTENMPFAVIAFLGLWVFFTFTYLRQVLGCTIVWLSIQYIYKRDFKHFLLVWFIGYSFHNSAMVFLPMYFIPIKKYSQNNVIAVMVMALIFGLSPIPQSLFEMYGEMDTDRASATYSIDTGFRYAYLIESVFFLYVILSNYKTISKRPKDIVLLNMALVFCAILLIFVRSENGGRLSWHYMLGLICTISTICVRHKIITRFGVVFIFLCLFLYLRVYNGWQSYMNLYPYKTFLTNGHREGDPVYQQYEYDENYDLDKFYR
jgi:hypothetical protein